MKLNVIHIFAYGEAQIISDTLNHKASNSEFTKLQAVIDDVKAKKPVDKVAKDYHSINIFSDKVIYMTADGDADANFRIKYSDLNQTKINALIAEFQALKDAVA